MGLRRAGVATGEGGEEEAGEERRAVNMSFPVRRRRALVRTRLSEASRVRRRKIAQVPDRLRHQLI